MKESSLLELVEGRGEQAWIGAKMPFTMQSIDLLNSNNFRVSSSLHHKFDIVWFYEGLFDDVGKFSWKIVLDEMIRLINGDGKLVIRMHRNNNPSLFMVKKFLGRHLAVECEMEYESCDKEADIWTTVYKIKRVDFEKYLLKEWTFVMLTLGNQVESVIGFLKSVRDNEGADKNEIIIAGPENSAYDDYGVQYIDWKPFCESQYAEISKKKNAAIKIAKNANIMIVHDRYILDKKFFEGFNDYGYDFDFLTVKQYTLGGEEFPSYAATKTNLRLRGQIMVNNTQKLYNTSYLNGGLIIAKTHIIEKLPFNGLLLWNQMEDAELAQVFMERSIIPRINFISKAITLVLKEGYLASWVSDENFDMENKSNMDKPVMIEEPYGVYSRLARHIPQSLKHNKLYNRLKGKIIKTN